MNADNVSMLVHLPRELRQRLKVRAAEQNATMLALTVTALRALLGDPNTRAGHEEEGEP